MKYKMTLSYVLLAVNCVMFMGSVSALHQHFLCAFIAGFALTGIIIMSIDIHRNTTAEKLH